MNISLYIFLFIYFAFMAIFCIFMFVNLYHLATSASLTLPSFIFTFFVFSCTVLILYTTAVLLSDVDWQQSVFQIGDTTQYSSDLF